MRSSQNIPNNIINFYNNQEHILCVLNTSDISSHWVLGVINLRTGDIVLLNSSITSVITFMRLYRKLFYVIKIIKNLRRNKFDVLDPNI